MHPKNLQIENFRYKLTDDRIAKFPLQQRDQSKLLIYHSGVITEDKYHNIATHLPTESLLVFNQTKVIHARLLFRKATGSLIEIFCLEPDEQYGDIQCAMLQKGQVLWKCMIGGANKWKQGMTLVQNFPDFILSAAIISKESGLFTLQLSWDNPQLSFAEVLHVAGKVPLPPYLHREAEQTDEVRYQTIYAKEEGSVAAPTAGLHFTKEVLRALTEKNIHSEFVTLHVGAGTFKPVTSKTMTEHAMHAEWIDVSVTFIQNIIAQLGKRIIAVGTTSLRTIESLYWMGVKLLHHTVPDFAHVAVTQWEPYELDAKNISVQHSLQALVDWLLQNRQQRLNTRTQILIAPGYEFKVVDGLVTNFHQPQSTLLLLVAALIGNDWHSVYEYALNNDFRFLSYGDGSLLWRK